MVNGGKKGGMTNEVRRMNDRNEVERGRYKGM